MSYIQPKIEASEKIIKKAIKNYKPTAIAFSGGSDSLVILNLSLPYYWDIPVIFVDTHYQFPETYKYIDYLEKEWNLNLFRFKAEKPRYDDFLSKYGEDTEDFYFNCCMYHKISILMKSIKDLNLKSLIVGIRAVEHPERAKETYISYKENLDPPHFRIHPILDWTRQDIIDYTLLFSLPINPLYKKGYTSLGCIYCTKQNPNPRMGERYGRARKRELIKRKMKEEGYN